MYSGVMITLPEMIKSISEAVSTFPDKRTGKNTQYTLADAALGAFSVFFTQSPSFLAHQKVMQQSLGVNNASSLFGLIDIPSDNHIRDLLDQVEAERVFPVFDFCFDQLLKHSYINQFKQESGELLIALDGTESFSSESIHCDSCLTKEHKKGVKTYSHSMLTPVIVSPEKNQVIPLFPEYITPQDGDLKQDCENKAAKRWLKGKGKLLLSKLTSFDSNLRVTVLGDDLYSRQPVMEDILKGGFNFILVGKEESHPYLYQWIKDLEEGEGEGQKQTITDKRWTGKFHEITTYKWANNVPFKDSAEPFLINWCEITITREETGKGLYHNTFVTRHKITKENVADIVSFGRARWKIENENNNTLKTKGYHLEHNFGHGKKHLSQLLASFTLLSFLIHTVMDLSDDLYHNLRGRLGSREAFFNAIKNLTIFMYFRDWSHSVSYTHLTLPTNREV